MKKLINGTKYDTDKALEIGEWSNGHFLDDFEYCRETLYKTPRSGKFFMFGEGGAMSKYASRSGNTSGWGEDLIEITKEDALKWAENRLSDAESLENYFADMITMITDA